MKKITRRQFLTSAGATSAALLLSSLPHAAAADENCLRKVTPAATNSNDLSWDMAEEILTHISDPVFPAYTVNVLDYGAVPNDGKLDTAAIQRAIDETSAHGGGTVVIPSGVYDVGAITLKSNVNLHLESKDTILRFTRDITPANYPLVFAHYEGSKLYNWSPLIYAYQQENIALTGKGTLDGQADKNNWWNWSRTVNPDGTITKPGNKDVKLLRKMTDNGTPAEERIFGEGHYLRPNFYQPIECTNVLIEGVTIANSPMWELNPVLCTNFTARGVTIDTHGYNNDGCDPENCNYVLIENCFFNTGDDCIAVKAGRNRDGRELGEAGHPTQNLIIRNNTFADGHGGIACGSEMSGGIKNLFADNNTFDSPTLNYALRFKTNAERGGAVENIYLRNSKVKSVGNAVVHATMLYDVGRDGNYLPQFKNITIENLTSSGGEYGIFMEAFEEVPITGLVFRNVEMRGVKAPFVINMFYFCDPDGHGPYVQCRDAMPVDEYTPRLGTLTMEDIVATDAQFAGCYFDGLPEQPIERISMKNVTITFDPNAMADNRPNVKKLPIYAENVKEIDLHNVKITGYEGERLRFANVGHFEED